MEIVREKRRTKRRVNMVKIHNPFNGKYLPEAREKRKGSAGKALAVVSWKPELHLWNPVIFFFCDGIYRLHVHHAYSMYKHIHTYTHRHIQILITNLKTMFIFMKPIMRYNALHHEWKCKRKESGTKSLMLINLISFEKMKMYTP